MSPGAGPDRGRSPARTMRWVLTVLVLMMALVLVAVTLLARDTAGGGGERATVAAAPLPAGVQLDRAVPDIPLIDEHGRRTSLRAFRGRYVIFAPTLTLCHEVCPMTTGALMEVRRRVRRAGLGKHVAVVEITVDPWRDRPARLRAYKRLTGAKLRILTGSRANIKRLWKFFGVYYKRVPQDDPPDVDWWTHKPEKFDIQHGDGLFFLGPRGRWKAVTLGMPDVGGHLSPRLRRLLNDEGVHNLKAPNHPWRVSQALGDLWHLMGRRPPGDTEVAGGGGPPTSAEARAALAGSPKPLASLHAQAGRLLAGDPDAFRARLASLRGRPVVVNVWASWCSPCRREFDLLQAASATYGRKVAFLGLDAHDTPGDARKFLAEHPISYPSYDDGDAKLAQSLTSLQGLPTTIFLDRHGKVSYVHAGEYTSEAALATDIRNVLAAG